MRGVTDPGTEELLRRSGLVLLGTVADQGLPSTDRAWHAVAGVHRPTAAVPLATEDLAAAVDAGWLTAARECGVLAPGVPDRDGTFLIALSRHEPWTEVRLGDRVRLAEHLVGENARPGQGEFVTLARDGSVTCGVTTEEYDVWIVADSKHLHAAPPTPADPAGADLSKLNFMQVNRLFEAERLRPPYQDGWTLLAFHRTARYLTRLHELGDEATELPWFPAPSAQAAELIPLTAAQARELGAAAAVPIDDDRLAYYLEYQTAAVKSRQGKTRRLPA
ncbi:hypothetical protein ACEZDB_26455 [Streptacidiphilus sp. N1-3]|uniref:Uncharacterized protein n=1 Tax=Streptacidiphilus alkalitolerans TaxID=3342712 RepID=A0ABV6X7D2_9ACTN